MQRDLIYLICCWWHDYSSEVQRNPYHRQRVEVAVGVEFLFDLLFALGCCLRVDCFLICGDCHAAILDTVETAVGEIRAKGGQHSFDAPASVLAGVVVAVAGDGEQVDDALDDGLQGWGEFGEACGEVAHHAALEAGTVGEDGTLFSAEIHQ